MDKTRKTFEMFIKKLQAKPIEVAGPNDRLYLEGHDAYWILSSIRPVRGGRRILWTRAKA